jgi:hypothetical protein
MTVPHGTVDLSTAPTLPNIIAGRHRFGAEDCVEDREIPIQVLASFDDVHEGVERRGIAAVVREAGRPRP